MRFPLSGFVLYATCAVLALPAPSAGAGAQGFSPLDPDVLEQTTLVPAAESVTAYTVPSDARVVLTRFCGNGCVRCAGETLGPKAFDCHGRRCVEHTHGIELPPGETIRCTNVCKTMGAAMFSGVLGPQTRRLRSTVASATRGSFRGPSAPRSRSHPAPQ